MSVRMFKNRWLNMVVMVLLMQAFILGLAGCDNGTGLTAREHADRAIKYRDEGNIRAAIIEFKNALEQDPKNQGIRYELGRVYILAGDGLTAEKEIKRAIELGFSQSPARLVLARALLLQNQYQASIDLDINPDELTSSQKIDYFTTWGYAYLGTGDPDRALDFFSKALKIDANAWDARAGRARTLVSKGDFEGARGLLAQLFEKNSEYGPAWSLLAQIERFQGKREEAEAAYSKAIEYKIANQDDLVGRALVRISLGEYQSAEEDIQAIQGRAKIHPIASYLKGLLAFQQARYAEAQSEFEDTLNTIPDYFPAIYFLGQAHYMQGQYQQAITYLQRVVNRQSEKERAAILLASARLKTGDFESASTLVSEILARDPANPQALSIRADIALGRRQGAEATRDLEKMASMAPDSSDTFLKLGLGLLMEGKQEAGVDALRRAMELDARQYQANVLLIMNYLQMQEFEKALEMIGALQEKIPESAVPYSLRGTALAEVGDKKGAKEAFLEAWKRSPGSAPIGRSLARLAIQGKDYDTARSYYLEVLERSPKHLMTLIELANLEQGTRNVSSAQEYLRRAVDASPTDPNPRTLLAQSYLSSGQLTQALAVISAPPDRALADVGFLEIAGLIYLQSNRYMEAKALFTRLVSLRPSQPTPLFYLAAAQRGMGEEDEARALLEMGNSMAPKDLNILAALTKLEIDQKRFDRAGELLDQVRKLDSQGMVTNVLSSDFYAQQQQYTQAVEVYEQIVASKPSRDAAYTMMDLYQRAGKRDHAVTFARKWLEQDPGDLRVRLLLAQFLQKEGETDASILEYERVLATTPDNPIALNNLANIYADRDLVKAVSLAKEAYDLAPKSPAIGDTYGWLLFKNGDNETAQRVLLQVRRADPGNPTFAYHLAEVLNAQGNPQQARELLTAVLGEDFPEQDAAAGLLEQIQ